MSDPLIGRLLADRFEVQARIGEGGFTATYRALQPEIDRLVALKILAAHVARDEEWVARFHAAARAVAKVAHPNVVQIYDFGTTPDGFHFIAMEHLRGESLRNELDRGGPLPARRALERLLPACRGLAALHRQGIVLRDLKPESIFLVDMLGAPDVIKVLFSTILKLTQGAPVTRPGVVLGTPWYMSPEQLRARPLGPESDVYAAGVVLYELLCGRRPFDGDNPTEIALSHLRAPPPPLADEVPGIVQTIVYRALAKLPEQRPRGADALADELEMALSVL